MKVCLKINKFPLPFMDWNKCHTKMDSLRVLFLSQLSQKSIIRQEQWKRVRGEKGLIIFQSIIWLQYGQTEKVKVFQKKEKWKPDDIHELESPNPTRYLLIEKGKIIDQI